MVRGGSFFVEREGAVIWHTKKKGGMVVGCSVKRSTKSSGGSILLFLIDYSEGQGGDCLVCTTPEVY